MRYFLELAYNGKNYCGWQIQPSSPSVQETVNKALNVLVDKSISIVGCGRTDTGVHARYFVAHFDTDVEFDKEQLMYKINRVLPEDIVIYTIAEVADDAHARFDAVSRTYEYHIDLQKNPFAIESSFFYKYSSLDVDAMNRAAAVLFDYIDFTSFSKLHTDVKTNNCKIMKAEWIQCGQHLVFTIKADRFLRNMVRAITGTLIDVGRGKINISDFRNIIEQKNRGEAGVSAPAHALYLIDVEYPESVFVAKSRVI